MKGGKRGREGRKDGGVVCECVGLETGGDEFRQDEWKNFENTRQ